MSPLVDFEVDLWVKGPHQPILEFLCPLLGFAGLERRANDVLGAVLDSPDQVSRFEVVERCRVRQGR